MVPDMDVRLVMTDCATDRARLEPARDPARVEGLPDPCDCIAARRWLLRDAAVCARDAVAPSARFFTEYANVS